MGSISSAVQWWEEWQLRVLVLSSLVVQWLLFVSAIRRKYVMSSWIIRSFIWLAYLGSDAIAIYALAALFNRHRKQDYAAMNNRSIVELVWAPILLMHLGGQDCITAYNIEDNELWRRHVLIAVSQITVALYVSNKSWPTSWPAGRSYMLVHVSAITFVPGILKCLEKPWALKKASINSLVSSSDPIPGTAVSTMGNIISLQEYVKKAKEIVNTDGRGLPRAQGQGNDANGGGQEQDRRSDADGGQPKAQALDGVDEEDPSPPGPSLPHEKPLPLGIRRPSQLFADLASPYPDRIATLQSFWVLDKIEAYALLRLGICGTFDLLYTKTKIAEGALLTDIYFGRKPNLRKLLASYVRLSVYILPLLAICLLPFSLTKSYDENDVKITYVLFCCTAALEYFSGCINIMHHLVVHILEFPKENRSFDLLKRLFPVKRLICMMSSDVMVAQYSLVGFFARNQRQKTMMCILSSFGCKDLVDQLWCKKSFCSSAEITELVIQHVKKGWREEIEDAASYRKFNNRRGQWTLGSLEQQHLGWSIRRPFDESVLLWHIATDVCFYTSSPHQDTAWCENSPYHEIAVRCREISQYMMYLLFVNPEMLMAGTRRNLFTVANDQLEKIFKGQNRSSMQIINKLKLEEIGIIAVLKLEQGSLSRERGGFFHDAMVLVQQLHKIDDEKKVWEVIQGVWVEMLCYSASRCRGYLHAKSLATGGEFLTYIWLLLSHMGMETLPERLQGIELELPKADAAPSSSGAVQTLQRPDVI